MYVSLCILFCLRLYDHFQNKNLSVFDNNEKGIYFATEFVPQPKPEVVKGIVIDGYISNAKIYQDKNYNNIPDDSELLGKTDSIGNFDITGRNGFFTYSHIHDHMINARIAVSNFSKNTNHSN